MLMRTKVSFRQTISIDRYQSHSLNAAGAGIGAIQDNEKKKEAAQSSDAYQREYQNCLLQVDPAYSSSIWYTPES